MLHCLISPSSHDASEIKGQFTQITKKNIHWCQSMQIDLISVPQFLRYPPPDAIQVSEISFMPFTHKKITFEKSHSVAVYFQKQCCNYSQ